MAATTQPRRKPPLARPSGTRCGPRSLRSLRSLRRPGRSSGRPLSVPPCCPFGRVYARGGSGLAGCPHTSPRERRVFRPPRWRSGSPRPGRSRASWSRNRLADQPLSGRERVVSPEAGEPARPGEGQGHSARATSRIPGGLEGRALLDPARTPQARERSERAQQVLAGREREGFVAVSIVADTVREREGFVAASIVAEVVFTRERATSTEIPASTSAVPAGKH